MGTPETGDGVWVWPGVDKLPKDIGQMGRGLYGKSMICMQKICRKLANLDFKTIYLIFYIRITFNNQIVIASYF
jgi:hypothetical protein